MSEAEFYGSNEEPHVETDSKKPDEPEETNNAKPKEAEVGYVFTIFKKLFQLCQQNKTSDHAPWQAAAPKRSRITHTEKTLKLKEKISDINDWFHSMNTTLKIIPYWSRHALGFQVPDRETGKQKQAALVVLLFQIFVIPYDIEFIYVQYSRKQPPPETPIPRPLLHSSTSSAA